MAYCGILSGLFIVYSCLGVPFTILSIVTIFTTHCSGSNSWVIAADAALFSAIQLILMGLMLSYAFWDVVKRSDDRESERALIARLRKDRETQVQTAEIAQPVQAVAVVTAPTYLDNERKTLPNMPVVEEIV